VQHKETSEAEFTWQLIGIEVSTPIMLMITTTRVATRVREYNCDGRKFRRPAATKFGTDPYRPSVGAIASDDAPLVVESGEEFPAGNTWLSYKGPWGCVCV